VENRDVLEDAGPQAMRRLVGDGFLQFQRNYGTFVTWTARRSATVRPARVTGIRDRAQPPSYFRCAAPTTTTYRRRSGKRGRSDRNNLAHRTLNRDFHLVIAEASDSPRMVNMLTNAIEAPVVSKRSGSEGRCAQLSPSAN
jgi:DNA-binding FadR family transcriptional regulator